jgi:hypothetical protein
MAKGGFIGGVALVVSALASGALVGCNGNPEEGSSAYKEGKLGNGSFLFKCDDSVACDRWSTNSAKDFPTQIATGSNFNLRFVAEGNEGWSLNIKGKHYDGITLEAIGPFVSSGPEGFSAVSPGFGTVVARDNRGAVIDYVNVRIARPDGLVVYKADYKGTDPPRLQAVNMTVGQAQSFRTVAERGLEAMAGSVRVEWTSADPAIAQVESYSRGVVNIVAKGEGKTKLTAAGAALTKEIDVEVAK